jgi:hypothetical protein
MQVNIKRLDLDAIFEFLERTTSKVLYLFKFFPSNQTSPEFSYIYVTKMTTLEALLLLIVAMTLLGLWTRERHLQQKANRRDNNTIHIRSEDVKVVMQLCRSPPYIQTLVIQTK